MKKSIWWIVGIVVIVVIVIALSNRKPTESGPIKIGFVGPLTGDAAAYGEPIKKGTEIAVDEINAAGGIDGRTLEVYYEDGKCSNKDASSAAQKLISIDGVKVIIGMICSGEVLSVAPVAESAKVIVLGQGSSPDITSAGDYVFRTFPSDTVVGTALVDHMQNSGVKSVAIVAENTSYALALEKDFTERLKSSTVKLVSLEHYNSDMKDYRTILQKVKIENPEVILLDSQTGASGARLAQQARDLGITSTFYTAYFSGPEFVKAGQFVEGTYVVDAPALGTSSVRASTFLAESKRRYGTEPTYPFFSANAYDQVYLLAGIFKKVGTNDVEKIKNELYETKAFQGITGVFGFDSNGDVVGIGMRMMQIRNGELIPVE